MKCLILAGGRGEGLWPLSRENYPKQFIEVQKNHSLFQETVARNIPYCDEFIIITNYECRFIVENQMKVFQGTPYRCIFEEEPRKTTAAIALACLDLQPSELVFVVAADHLIDTTSETVNEKYSYKDAILKAKELAKNGDIILFGLEENQPNSRFGYFEVVDNNSVKYFCEKPGKEFLATAILNEKIYRNIGMMIFQNGSFQKEFSTIIPTIFEQCKQAFKNRKMLGSHTFYPEKVLNVITPISIEKGLIENAKHLKAVVVGFQWSDIGNLEDLSKTDLQTVGKVVSNDCINTAIINTSTRQIVVANEVDDVLIVNTPDALYVGKQGKSSNLKEMLHDHPEIQPCTESGKVIYRSWGYYEQLIEENSYRVRKVMLFPGKTIYEHKHLYRDENWSIVEGEALVTLDGVTMSYTINGNINIPKGVSHQISNIGENSVVFIETSVGDFLQEADMISVPVDDISEAQLGYETESMIKLLPAYKDYLWGGTKLRDIYNKQCDYDVVAESWELSAHPAGQSIVASGKHKGKKFGDYLKLIGKESLGWKCSPLQNFPLLIKFIDAKGDLSVQVHPDDDYALENENEYGKNEMWYVIDSEPGAGLYVGFNRDVSKEEIEQRVKDNTIMDVLNFYPTKPGDVFFIPAGTVHAIGAGNLICEIQQSSNCTYRLYDYDRRDKFGNPRELHLQKALDVLDLKKYEPVDFEMNGIGSKKVLSQCKYFESIIYEVKDEDQITIENDRFNSIICIKGNGILQIENENMNILAGESIFVPAKKGLIKVVGQLSIVLSHI